MLHIKVKGPDIEKFIDEHTSNAAVFLWAAKVKRKGENEKQKNIRNIPQRLNRLDLYMNSSISFLKAAVMKMKTMLLVH